MRSTTSLAGAFGALSTSHSFCTAVHFEHVLLPLLKSGLLPPTSKDALLAAHPLIMHLHCSVMRLASLDFSSLRKPHPVRQQTSIAPSWVCLFLAALLHFNLSVPSLIRYLGGNHTSAWRDIPALMSYLKSMIPDHDLSDLRRVLQVGCPAVLNATTSRSNFLDYWRYGNHSTIASYHDNLVQSLAKEDAYQYILPLPSWLARFIPNLHLNPLGLVVKPGKDNRLVIDPSFWVGPDSTPINSLTHIGNEPPIRFASALTRHLSRIYNLRITYPDEDIPTFSDDASGEFKTTKLHPDVATAFAYAYRTHLCVPTAAIFGSNTSPPNFEPIAGARTRLATALFADPRFTAAPSRWVSMVAFSAPPGCRRGIRWCCTRQHQHWGS